jgi:hypothetical protein
MGHRSFVKSYQIPRYSMQSEDFGGLTQLSAVGNPEACAFKGAIVQTPPWDLEPHQQPFAIGTFGPTCRFMRHLQCAQGPLSVSQGMGTPRYRLNPSIKTKPTIVGIV